MFKDSNIQQWIMLNHKWTNEHIEFYSRPETEQAEAHITEFKIKSMSDFYTDLDLFFS